MDEELLVTARANALIDPSLHIWTWEVAMYLFMGGLTAGVMIFAALAIARGKEKLAPFTATRLALFAPILLSIGMTTLFLDLEHKLYVYRFYTTFRVLSPMSWGAWILIIIYPVSILQILSTLRRGVPQAAGHVDHIAIGRGIVDWCEQHRRAISLVALPASVPPTPPTSASWPCSAGSSACAISSVTLAPRMFVCTSKRCTRS